MGAAETKSSGKKRSRAKPRTGKSRAHAKTSGASHKKKPAKARSGALVIVESPAKARTIAKFLGKGYTVKASMGHVRDLPKKTLRVSVQWQILGTAPKTRRL